MNLFSEIRVLVMDSLNALVSEGRLPEGLSFEQVTVEPPRDAAHGDMATNAAMVLAKPSGQKPRDIAAALAEKLATDPRVQSTSVAGPVFLDLRLTTSLWHALVQSILAGGVDYRRPGTER
ncbi:MAG: arginine--tRNA ligase, partial [Halocynthiibacter sp.]